LKDAGEVKIDFLLKSYPQFVELTYIAYMLYYN